MVFKRIKLAICALMLASASAFMPSVPRSHSLAAQSKQTRGPVMTLQERRWNFNEGQAPWGLKKNAEIWNGRVAQMAFIFVFLQELIQGKGVIQGIQEGDPLNIAGLAGFAVCTIGLTIFLAIQGDDDFVKRDLERDGIKYK